MPDYRRFIAYFYEYIDGKRQRNAGFVKAEQRDGLWKINLQLKARRWPEEGVEIYGYHKEEQIYPVTLLAKGYSQKDCLMQKIQLKADWETVSGKPFETLSGMWIPCGEGRCFLSHWTDGEAELGKLRSTVKQYEIQPQIVMVKREKFQKEVNLAEPKECGRESPVMEQPEIDLPGGIAQTFTNQPEDLAWQEAPKLRREPQEFLEDMKRVVNSEENISEKVVEIITEEVEAEAIPEEVAEMEAETIPEEVAEVEERVTLKDAAEEEETVPEENTKEKKEIVAEEIKTETESDWQNQSRSRNGLIWQEMYKSHLKIMPFPGYECIVICPREVLWLRQQGWSVNRNSFLMQGFSQYHHLLFGKGNGGDFILGVPGVENPKNRSMAQAFGYGEFKAAAEWAHEQKKEEKSGKWIKEQFGYWCRKL